MSEPLIVAELLRVGTRVLEDSSAIFEDHDKADEARQLLALTLNAELDDIGDSHQPTRRQREKYLSLVARRAAGEPMPLIRGFIEFYGLELHVKPGAFVPRPSSELTVERALKRLARKRDPLVVEVCAGVAPISLAVAHEKPTSTVWAVDISKDGLNQGRNNARRLGVDNIHFGAGDMYAPLPKKLHGDIDLILAHVPYVPLDEIEDLPEEVKSYEPLNTLTDESDGTYLMSRAIAEGEPLLKSGGWLLLEMSDDMVPKARKMLKQAGFRDISVADDEDDLSVVVEAQKDTS